MGIKNASLDNGHYPVIPRPLRLLRSCVGLDNRLPPLPPHDLLSELSLFVRKRTEGHPALSERIDHAAKEGSPELRQYLSDNLPNRADHVANALHSCCSELSGQIEQWVSQIFWSQDWERKQNSPAAHSMDNSKIFQALCSQISQTQGGCNIFIEVGSGAGNVLVSLANNFPDIRFIGLDLSKWAVEALKRKGQANSCLNLDVINADMFHIPLADSSVDIAYNLGVIEHYESPEQLLAVGEMARIVRPGGRVIIAVPNYYAVSKILHYAVNGICWKNIKNSDSYMLWPFRYEAPMKTSELKRLFEDSGLKVSACLGWNPLFRIYRENNSFATAMSAWDILNERNLPHPARWITPEKSGSAHFMAFSKVLSLFGWFAQKLVVAPIDRMSGNLISNNFGNIIMMTGEKQE